MTLPKGEMIPKLTFAHQLHPKLLSKTGFHEETLARLGLMKSAKDYTNKTKYLSETTAGEASVAGGMMGLEFFSLCRSTMMDV